jgi:acetate---CoA ligase (ADP-forming)
LRDLRPLLWPRSIAVIGASEDTTKIRGRVLSNLLRGGFTGQVWPVTRSGGTVFGLPACSSVADLPEAADLALVLVPAERVPAALEACAARGVSAAVIYSSGFAEAGESHRGLQEQVTEIAERSGLLVCGPNSVGFVNLLAPLVATFSPAVDPDRLAKDAGGARGGIGIVSQSGGISAAILGRGLLRGLPFSYVVSSGNEAGLDLGDYARFMLDDGRTDVILMFLEGIRYPARFVAAAARAASLGRPLVVAKVGRSTAGQRAAASHTASLTGSNAAYDAVFHRYGIVRVEEQEEMLDVAAAMTLCPPARGRRIGIVTISGGMGVWAADACEAQGLEVPELATAERERFGAFLPPYASLGNPVDITAQALETGGRAKAIETFCDLDGFDGVLVVASLAGDRQIAAEGDALRARVAHRDKPIVFYSYNLPSAESLLVLRDVGIPCYSNLQGCVRGLRALVDYGAFQRERRWEVKAPDIVTVAKPPSPPASSSGALCEYEAKALLAAWGIPVTRETLAGSEAEAIAAAERIGFPVALKVQSPEILHKTEAGAIALGLASPEAVARAYALILANARRHQPGAAIRGVLVQEMARPGREVIAGVVNDRDFGPLIMVGLGGVHVEVLRDVAVAPLPLDGREAMATLRRLRSIALLEGVRGEPPADLPALADLLVRLAAFADAWRDRLAEVDLNPVRVYPEGDGAVVIDALMLISPEPPPLAPGAGDPCAAARDGAG